MDYLRQHDIIQPDDIQIPIHIIGCGGIGSPTAIALSKMGAKEIHLYDHDKVELHNLPNQFYNSTHINFYKAAALAATCVDYNHECDAQFHLKQMKGGDISVLDKGIIISAIDSMEGRHELWNSIKYNIKVPLYIDGRMAAQLGRIYTCNPSIPDEIKKYEDTLVDPSKVVAEPCTNKAIIYNTFMIAGIICNQVKRFCRKEPLFSEIVLDINAGTMLSF